MATNVVESTVIDAPLDVVWPLLRNADFRFLNVVSEGHLIHGTSWAEVGSVRKLIYADAQRTERVYSLDELSDLTHSLVFTMIDSKPSIPLQAAQHTIRCRRITAEPARTFVQFASEYSKDVTRQMLEESRTHKFACFHALAREAKHIMAEQHQHQGQGPFQKLEQKPISSASQEKPSAVKFPASKEQKQAGAKKACCGCAGECQCACCSGKPHQKGVGKNCCGCTGPCNCVCCAQTKPAASMLPAQHAALTQPGKRSERFQKYPQLLGIGFGGQGRTIPISGAHEESGPHIGASPPHAQVPPLQSQAQGGAQKKYGAPIAVGAQQPHPQPQPSLSRQKERTHAFASSQSKPPTVPAAAAADHPAALFEKMDFGELKNITSRKVDEVWNEFDKNQDGVLSSNEANDLIDAVMTRMAEEDNEIVHSVARMLREPDSPPSFASTQDFTPQLRDELKKTTDRKSVV